MSHQIEFSDEEKDFILRHIGPGPERMSWGEIADALNQMFPSYNNGKRSRNSVYRWATEYTRGYAAAFTTWRR